MPPVAAIWLEHNAFCTQEGNVVGVANESGAPVPTSSVYFCDAAEVSPSQTVTSTGYGPACAMVPLSTPAAEIESPFGKLADDHV